MKTNLYSVFDSAAEAFGPPFTTHTHALAAHILRNAAADTRTTVNQRPGDFTLWHLGAFQDSSAQFELLPAPVRIPHAQVEVTPK